MPVRGKQVHEQRKVASDEWRATWQAWVEGATAVSAYEWETKEFREN